MPEEVKRAIRPMDGFVVTPQRAMGIQPPSPHENDPFVMAPPPLTIARPPYQRRMTVATSQASCSVQSHELILAPGPTINPSSRAHSQQSTESQSQNNNRQSVVPTGPLFVRLTKTSTLSNIPALPPPSAPATGALREPRRKTLSPAKTISFADELVTAKVSPPEISQPIIRRSPTLLLPSTDSPSPPSSPTRASKRGERNPSMLSPQINTTIGLTKKRSSTSSSLYSIEGPDSKVPISAVELNTVSFRSNSRLSLIAGDSSPGDDHLAITSTIASLRRMNSTMSTASITFPSSSSTNQIVHSRRPPSPSLGISLAAQQRKSIGTGNYLSLGRGGKRHLPQSPHSALKKPKRLSGSSRPLSSSSSSSSRPVSREIIPLAYPVHDSHNRSSSGWEWGGSFPESSPSNSPPHKRRKPASMHQRRNSLLRMSVLETLEDMCGPVPSGSVSGRFTESIEEKENTPPRTTTTTGRAREEEIEQPPKGEFTFVVSNPDASYDLRSMNHEHRQQQQQASMRPWNHSSLASSATSAAIGMERRQNNGSPSRQSVRSVRSVDSLGLYDPQGFLIGTPQRGNSPTKFGGGSGDRNGGGRSPSPGKLRM
ncbi:hypothetical protein QBC35DRAFT_486888 [Podospora australis]|uniref:Uncharacterized protein n=1 Tax=Podospora australis TaxID=1536484 RepID=A0AAN6X0B3_9PEZI|nr:hypothetical protein QBC35DRAFT_486888 [Podospora australis]